MSSRAFCGQYVHRTLRRHNRCRLQNQDDTVRRKENQTSNLGHSGAGEVCLDGHCWSFILRFSFLISYTFILFDVGFCRFRTLTSYYYRGAHGIIVVYDITKMESFRNVELWFQEIDKNAGVYTRKILVGNKVDLEEERAVPYRDAKEFADNFGVTLIEASAKEAKNVDECFMRMAAEIMET